MGNRPVPFVNTHSDYPMAVIRRRRCFQDHVMQAGYLPTQRNAGLCMEVMTVGTDHRFPILGGVLDMAEPRTVIEILDAMHLELSETPDHYGLVLHGDDIDPIIQAGRIALMFNLEGVACVEDDFSLWRNYYRLGVRALSLTHDPQNRMASGCREPDGGLTRLGRRFVSELNDYNVVLDLVHAGERSFFGALEHYEGTVVVSHSNAKAVWDCPRNLTDDQIRAVGERGGFVAVMFCGAFLREDASLATLDDVVRHIDHIAGLIGIDHVAVGPDYVDYMMDFFPDLLKPLGVEPGAVAWAKGGEQLATIQQLSQTLSAHGYKDEDIAKVMGANALRVYRQILSRHARGADGPGMHYGLGAKLE